MLYEKTSGFTTGATSGNLLSLSRRRNSGISRSSVVVIGIKLIDSFGKGEDDILVIHVRMLPPPVDQFFQLGGEVIHFASACAISITMLRVDISSSTSAPISA